MKATKKADGTWTVEGLDDKQARGLGVPMERKRTFMHATKARTCEVIGSNADDMTFEDEASAVRYARAKVEGTCRPLEIRKGNYLYFRGEYLGAFNFFRSVLFSDTWCDLKVDGWEDVYDWMTARGFCPMPQEVRKVLDA